VYNAQPYEEILENICSNTIAPAAAEVDRESAFPQASIDALAGAGLLGAMSATEMGGLGLGLAGGARIVRRIAEECGSTAMVVTMHLAGVTLLEAWAPADVRREAAAGRHLSTLAFSEAGSRSHFWAPVSTAERRNGHVVLNARKSWITSASHASAYLWSSRPVAAEGMSTMWLVPAKAPGIEVSGPFDGLGLRGNDSRPVTATDVEVPAAAMLGEDGKGFDLMEQVLPTFAVLSAACNVGFMSAAVGRTVAHITATRHADSGAALSALPTIRNYVARMRVKTDTTDALLDDAITALSTGRADAGLRVLESKSAAGETVNEVLDLAMRVCGGAAFRKETGIERFFRDARASGVMAPTTDVLYDFIGRALCGLPLL
jgi:alkylation response protein AidB-like acyl-CoA dehydrogenase